MFAKTAILFAALAAVQALGPLGYGAPLLAAAPYGGVSVQKTAINHVAPAASLAYGRGLGTGHLGYGLGAPLAYGRGIGAGHQGYGLGASLDYGHGLTSAPLSYGHGVLGARYGGVLGLGYGHGVLGARYGGVLGLGYGHGIAKAVL